MAKNNNAPLCTNCKRFGHVEERFWYKNKDQINYLTSNWKEEENSSEPLLLFTHVENEERLWYLDIGCSNHMTGDKSKFIELEKTK